MRTGIASIVIVLVCVALLCQAQTPPTAEKQKSLPPMPSPAEAMKKARVDGKYAMLIRQVKVAEDYETYKDFHDEGFIDDPEWAGQKNMPNGYYVYAYPYWFVWRDDVARAAKQKRAWGPEQVTGEPDTMEAGDRQTAWASKTTDEQDEWLLVEYAEPLMPTAIMVHANYNPGALMKASIFTMDGEEVEVWRGKDPTPTADGKGIGVLEIKKPIKTQRVKIYLDSKAVPGWNEIDAIGVLDAGQNVHWAVAADASSTYASGALPGPDRTEERVRRLERELRKLKKEIAELRKENGKK